MRSSHAAVFALGLAATLIAQADPTTVSVGDASVTAAAATTLNFPLTRTGDLGYDAFVVYHTIDGTAIGGTDYTGAVSNSVLVPAGAVSASIPVAVAAGTGADKSFGILLDTAAGFGFAPSFAVPKTFSTIDQPDSLGAVDLNGDGKPDLFTANFASTVAVLRNTTAPGAAVPSFAAPQNFQADNGPGSATAVDLNGDGRPDLMVANLTDGTVSVLRDTTIPGSAMPSFDAQQVFAPATGAIDATAVDINGDGRPDIIVGNLSSAVPVSVLLNTSTPGLFGPTFASPAAFLTASYSLAAITADLDLDGRPAGHHHAQQSRADDRRSDFLGPAQRHPGG